MKKSTEFLLGASWALRQIYKKLPLGNGRNCDCGADIIYYIDQIRQKIEVMK